MKIFKNVIASLVRRTTLCFTATVMCFAVVGSLADIEQTGKGLAIGQLTDFFVFSLILGAVFAACDFIKNNSVIRRTLQFVLTYAGFALVFFTGSIFKEHLEQMQNPAFSVLVVSFIFVVAYIAVALISLLIGFLVNRTENRSKEYVNMFEEQKKL